MDPASFGTAIGRSERTIYNYESGETAPGSKVLQKIAEVAGVSESWLLTGNGPMLQPGQGDGKKGEAPAVQESGEEVQRLSDEELRARGLLRIPEVEVSAGDGREVYLDEIGGEMILPAWYIRTEFGVEPSRLCTARVMGDSMEPTLRAGQRIYVVERRGEPLRDGVIYLLYGPDGIQVKRIRFDREDEDVRIWIWSDNEEALRYRLPRERFEDDYRVLGWVIQKSTWL